MIAVPHRQHYQDLCRGQVNLSPVSSSVVSLIVPIATTVRVGLTSFPVVFSTLLWRRHWSLFWRRGSFCTMRRSWWWYFRFRHSAWLRCCFRFAWCRCVGLTSSFWRHMCIGNCSQVGFRHVDAPPRPLIITLFDVVVASIASYNFESRGRGSCRPFWRIKCRTDILLSCGRQAHKISTGLRVAVFWKSTFLKKYTALTL